MTSMPPRSPAQRSALPAGAADPSPALSAAADRSLFADIMASTPSSTLSRELLALVLTLALVGLTHVILQPRPLVSAILLAAMSLFLLGRLAAGVRTRAHGRSPKGGR